MESITTQRLIIRRLSETDLSDFLAYQNHPNVLVYSLDGFISEAEAIRFLNHQAQAQLTDQRCEISLAIHHQKDNKMIGTLMLYFSAKIINQGEVGWGLHPNYQGHGYATEATQALLNYAFINQERHRMIAKCDPRNTPSIRLMERLGMRREGHFKKSRLLHDQWCDEYLYAILREEWKNRDH